jgi:hypothetical protein
MPDRWSLAVVEIRRPYLTAPVPLFWSGPAREIKESAGALELRRTFCYVEDIFKTER